jgi:hypothetical protein
MAGMSASAMSGLARLSCLLLAACGSSVLSPTGAGGVGGGGSAGTGGAGQACQRELRVFWQIVDNATDMPITCADASASSVNLEIRGPELVGMTHTQACAAAQSSGEFVVTLDRNISYAISVLLLDAGSAVLSKVNPPVISPGCSGSINANVVLPVDVSGALQ